MLRLINNNNSYFICKWIPVGTKPEKINGFTYRTSQFKKTINGQEHVQVTYRAKTVQPAYELFRDNMEREINQREGDYSWK